MTARAPISFHAPVEPPRAPVEPARARTRLAPVSPRDRVSSIDTLRGVALLGILPVNMVAFALPLAAYVTPMNEAVNVYRGPFRGLAAAAWLVPHLLCELKMMTIFSLLFGAGLILIDRKVARHDHASPPTMGPQAAPNPALLRSPSEPARFAGVYYRRLAVLALFGLVHGFALWYGDILVYYAISGAILYPLRNLKPRTLIFTGMLLVGVQMGLNAWEGSSVAKAREAADRVELAVARGESLTEAQREAQDEWESIQVDHDPTPAQVDEEIAAVRGAPSAVMRRNTELMVYNLTSSELAFWLVRALGAMLIGMGAMKLRVLSAERSTRLYTVLMLCGYGLGFPIVAAGLFELVRHRFDPVFLELVGRQYNFVGSWLVAIGHVGLVMLVCKHGWLSWLTSKLAAVGRMALTNYLAQSILGVTLFTGWGLGLFARLTHVEVLLVVGAIWAAQLFYSSRWLARFRYGPAEWLWRSLTYGRLERMLLEPAVAREAASPCYGPPRGDEHP